MIRWYDSMVKHDINLLHGIVFNTINTKNKRNIKKCSANSDEFLNIERGTIAKTFNYKK